MWSSLDKHLWPRYLGWCSSQYRAAIALSQKWLGWQIHDQKRHKANKVNCLQTLKIDNSSFDFLYFSNSAMSLAVFRPNQHQLQKCFGLSCTDKPPITPKMTIHTTIDFQSMICRICLQLDWEFGLGQSTIYWDKRLTYYLAWRKRM